MNEYKQKAEQYVRSQIPELMELSKGCVVRIPTPERYSEHADKEKTTATVLLHCWQRDYDDSEEFFHVWLDDWNEDLDLGGKLDEDEYEIIGHPIQLQHWLRVLDKQLVQGTIVEGELSVIVGINRIRFNLTTGQPATKADYRAFCEIVGI